MGRADAQISIGADASAATRAAAIVKAAWRDASDGIQSAIGSAARAVIGDLSNVALQQGKVSFASQHQQVREFEGATARMAVAAGRDLGTVRTEAEATGIAIGKRPGEVASWTNEVGKLTYNFRGAGEAIRGVAALAAETNRSVEDYRGLAVVLGTVGRVGGDTSQVLGVLAAQAEQPGRSGGIAAFAQQIEGLGDVISRFAVGSERDFLRITALASELGRGLSPAAAGRVQQSAFGAIASDPLRWERFLGKKITDEHGQVEHPEEVLAQITEKVKKRYGSNARRVLMLNFGAETGAAMFNADFGAAAKASGLAPSTGAAQAQKAYLETDAGKREVAEAELAKSSIDLMGSSTKLGAAADKLQQWAAHNPISTTILATAMGTATTTFLASFGGSIARMMGGSGAGGGVGGAVDLATKGTSISKLGLAGILGLIGLEGAAESAISGSKAKSWQSALGRFGIGGEGLAGLDVGEMTADDVMDMARDPARLRAYVAQQAQAKVKRDQAAGAKISLGIMADAGLIQPASFGSEGEPSGRGPGSEENITRAMERANLKAHVTIINETGGPIGTAEEQSHSAAAGHQG